MGIKTSVLPYHVMNLFVKDVVDNDNYYVFASSLLDTEISNNSETSSRKFLEKTIFGKKVSSIDVKYMIRKVIWSPGIVYDQYDDTKDLSLLNYYVISEPDSDSGDYYVFKCIDNNLGGVSSDKPTFNTDLPLTNYILRTSDNYTWKLMYSVKSSEYNFYRTRTLFPIIPNLEIQTSSKSGIDNIIVENIDTNNGYETVIDTVNSIGGNFSGNRRVFLNITDQSFNRTAGYYANYSFYVTSSDGITSKLYTIINSGARSTDQRPFVDIANYNGEITDVSTMVWSYSILPQVQIVGDGTGATAIPILVGTSIQRIQVLTQGQGYTRAIATIVKPNLGFDPSTPASGDATCILRVLIGPSTQFAASGGHGSNAVIELNSRHVLLTTELDGIDDMIIPTTNTYSKIGIVRGPSFSTDIGTFDNRIKVRVPTTAQLEVGSVITQPASNFRATIHSIDDINNFIYLTEFFGPYFDQSETSSFYLSRDYINPDLPLVSIAGNIGIIPELQEPSDTGVVYPVYNQMTGEVLYMSDFAPVERSNNLTEQFKFIIEF